MVLSGKEDSNTLVIFVFFDQMCNHATTCLFQV